MTAFSDSFTNLTGLLKRLQLQPAPPPLPLLKHTDLRTHDSLTYAISLGLLTLPASEAGDWGINPALQQCKGSAPMTRSQEQCLWERDTDSVALRRVNRATRLDLPSSESGTYRTLRS